MIEKGIGAIAVMPEDEKVAAAVTDNNDNRNRKPMPVGIITKSDIIKAYQNMVGIDDPCESIMHTGDLKTCTPTVDRDRAARLLEENHNHHLLVVSDDDPSVFVGLVSSWDITAECARDDRAWPWIRSEDGKFHNPLPKKKPVGQHFDRQTILHHNHEANTVYMDELDVMNFQ
jgi:CBS-domain-containing membrane protein